MTFEDLQRGVSDRRTVGRQEDARGGGVEVRHVVIRVSRFQPCGQESIL